MFIDPTFGVLIPQPTCDFDGNRSCDLDDINRLMTQIAGGDHNIRFDLNNDSRVSNGDHDQWLKLAAQERGLREAYLVGDSNLNGMVGPEDLNALGRHWQRGSHLWSAGNFTGGNVNSADLNALALNWRKSIRTPPAANAVVPEPSTLLLMVFAIALVCGVRGNSTRHALKRESDSTECAHGSQERAHALQRSSGLDRKGA